MFVQGAVYNSRVQGAMWRCSASRVEVQYSSAVRCSEIIEQQGRSILPRAVPTRAHRTRVLTIPVSYVIQSLYNITIHILQPPILERLCYARIDQVRLKYISIQTI